MPIRDADWVGARERNHYKACIDLQVAHSHPAPRRPSPRPALVGKVRRPAAVQRVNEKRHVVRARAATTTPPAERGHAGPSARHGTAKVSSARRSRLKGSMLSQPCGSIRVLKASARTAVVDRQIAERLPRLGRSFDVELWSKMRSSASAIWLCAVLVRGIEHPLTSLHILHS